MRANVAELYRLYMLDIPDGPAKDQGIAIGRAAATAMNGARADDGRFVGHAAVADRHAQGRMAPGGNRQCERVRLGRQRRPVHAEEHGPVPHGGAV